MATSQNDHLWALMRTERAALADDLSTLTPKQWRHTTLCGEWNVEDAVAHLIAAASTNQLRWLRSIIGARFRVDVHNQRRIEEFRGRTPEETLERFRRVVDSTTSPSGHIPAYLGEVLVHSQDIRQPLGLSRTPSVKALIPVAEFFAERDFAVNSHSLVKGLSLRAADGMFAVGVGPMVSGSLLALVMTMAGRSVYLEQLEGPGVHLLRERLLGADV
ncbi:maleylpyruvate isomerase family mycothiol-dependent enzyme [Kocuria carniphila]|uniref:maleylpyruvate isomerase family mycothiol-dependent enzyme n=1 Tax=Kocuria carniphila TaxID=262208 RepID=UPI0034CD9A16